MLSGEIKFIGKNDTPALRPITEDEWMQYEWVSVGQLGSEPFFVRGFKRVPPPEDGFHYVDVTRLSDTEQRWARAMTYSDA